tara:strand:- start:11992 stop:12123 length:132 start_codon:yes stop_codon:yes gene_type:complete
MAINERWNSMSRLNCTRISVGAFLVVCILAVSAVPVALISGVL